MSTGITITGAAPVVAGGTLSLVSVIAGDGCANAAVNWASSDLSAFTVTSAGAVTAVTAGTATITATAGGKSAQVDVTSMFPTAVADARFGYAWASEEATGSYVASTGYELNTGASGTITLEHTATGTYTATFAGLAAAAGQKENVQVAAYGSAAVRCKLASWNTVGSDLRADVRCFSMAGGAPVDSRYDVFAAGQTALQGRSAFVVTPNSSASSYFAPAATTQTSSRGGVQITHAGAGTYSVRLTGMARGSTGGAETFQVTAIGSGSEFCTVISWGDDAADLRVTVRCFATGGGATDAQFSLLMLERGRSGKRVGFAWADQQLSTTSYSPSSFYAMNSSGGVVTSLRMSMGVYQVTFAGLVRVGVADRETVLATAYSGVGVSCGVGSWDVTAAAVVVRCYDATGAAVDARFTILWIE